MQPVWDRIPEIIEKSGKRSIVETLGGEAFKMDLDKKLAEEMQEYYERYV